MCPFVCVCFDKKKEEKKGSERVGREEKTHSNNLAHLRVWLRLRAGGPSWEGTLELLNPEEEQGETGEAPGRAQLPRRCSRGLLRSGLLAGNTPGKVESCCSPESWTPREKPRGDPGGGPTGLNLRSLWGTGWGVGLLWRRWPWFQSKPSAPEQALALALQGGCLPSRSESSERKKAKVPA